MALIVLGAMGLAIIVFGQVKSEPPRVPPTEAEWKKHEEYVESLARAVLLEKGTYKQHQKAREYLADGYTDTCTIKGCSEFRSFLTTVAESNGDGFVSPAEIAEIEAQAKTLRSALNEGRTEVKGFARRK